MISPASTLVAQPVIRWSEPVAEPILEEARRRFRLRMHSGRGHADSGDAQELIDEMLAVTSTVFTPIVGQVELAFNKLDADVVVVNGVKLPAGPWAGHLYEGDTLLLYCLSAGARRADIWRACNEDPILASTAHLLGSEIAFAVGRQFDRSLRTQDPRRRWQRIALLKAEQESHERCRWDPRVGHAFFTSFAAQQAPIVISESGSFDPVHTVLGLFRRAAHHT